MKVILIPDNPVLKGNRAYYLAEALIRKGHEVHYITWDSPYHMRGRELLKHLFTSMLQETSHQDKITIHKIRRLPYYWPWVNGLLFKYQLKNIYRSLGVDFIFTMTYTNETEVPKSLPFVYDMEDDYAAREKFMARIFISYPSNYLT